MNKSHQGIKNILKKFTKNTQTNKEWTEESKVTENTSDIAQKHEENIENVMNETKEDIINISATPSPFPAHAWYTNLWKRLSPEEQKKLHDNVRITNDNKIEMIKMGEIYSLLHKPWTDIIPNEGNEYIDPFKEGITVQWNHKDHEWKTWIPWISYFDELSASETIHLTHPCYVAWSEQKIHRVLNNLPWATQEEKILNLIELLELPYTWGFIDDEDMWIQVGIVGYLRVALYNQGTSNFATRIFFSKDKTAVWIDNNNTARHTYIPTLVYEKAVWTDEHWKYPDYIQNPD